MLKIDSVFSITSNCCKLLAVTKLLTIIIAATATLLLAGCNDAPRLERNHLPSPAVSDIVPPAVAISSSASNERAGITDDEIKIGSCCALTGPAALLGTQLVEGAQTYLDYTNHRGGVNGRQIKLQTHDDGYEPDRAVSCFNQLLKEDVFAGAFFVGTPTAARYVPMAEAHQMPLLGLFTGAEFLHKPFRPHVISVRASYYDEVKEQVNSLWNMRFRRIAVIYQNDAFGATVLSAARLALDGHLSAPIALGSFARNTLDVDDAIYQVRNANPDAVIMAGSYAPLAQIVKRSHKGGWRPLFLTVSFVGTEAFIKEAGKDAEGTVITQVLPPYSQDDLHTVALFKRLLHTYYPNQEPTFTSFEGFVDAMVLVDGLKGAGRDLTRSKFISYLESIHEQDMGLGRLKLTYGPQRHKGFESVYSTVVHNGQPETLTDWRTLRKL